MVYGTGIDIIEVSRLEKQISSKTGQRFIERIFTEHEQSYCEQKKNRAQNYAARFAAKEAFMKALGTGWRKGLSFGDIEIVNDEDGKPEMKLYGMAKQFVEAREISNIQVSLSHLKDIAVAVVVLEK